MIYKNKRKVDCIKSKNKPNGEEISEIMKKIKD